MTAKTTKKMAMHRQEHLLMFFSMKWRWFFWWSTEEAKLFLIGRKGVSDVVYCKVLLQYKIVSNHKLDNTKINLVRHIWEIFQHPMISPRPENWVLWVKMLLWTVGRRTGNNDVHKNVSDRLNLVNVSPSFASTLINLLHFDFYGHTHTESWISSR